MIKIENIKIRDEEILKVQDMFDKSLSLDGSIWMDQNIYKIKKINLDSDFLVIIGAGGSYLGIEAAINFLGKNEKVIFIGNNFDAEDILRELSKIKGKSIIVNVISRSSNTLEPILSLKILEKFIEENSIECKDIYLTTASEGSLYKTAEKNGYKIIKMPEKLVGRYSCLFVGKLAFDFLGYDFEEIIKGSQQALKDNSSIIYSIIRNHEYRSGNELEIFQYYEKSLSSLADWWKQLFGESEGKNGKGIYPSSLFFSRDLHSIGQYLQEGTENFFQTTLFVNEGEDFIVDGLSMRKVNRAVFESSYESHKGRSTNIVIDVERRNEYNLGYLIFFFQKSALLSSLLLEVNPYDNEGVKIYKSHLIKKIEDFTTISQ
tara:strand:- start:887 stop:2011 length:1125 start_codon:yes stop_codon:yes gene_type:complete